MTYAPARLLEVRAFMRPITGLPDAQLGITPDEDHNGGYHCGWDDRRIVNGALSDYAWQESTRDSSHKTNAARAFDLGMFPRLRDFSVWLAGQCAAGAADCADIREVIYSPDGRVVRRWDRLGKRSTGDSSHLTHTHISWFADAEDRDKLGPFRRFFGDEMTPEEIRLLTNSETYAYKSAAGEDPITGIRDGAGKLVSIPNMPMRTAKAAQAAAEKALAAVNALAARPVDPAVFAAALKVALADPEVLAGIAKAVADEDHRRSAS